MGGQTGAAAAETGWGSSRHGTQDHPLPGTRPKSLSAGLAQMCAPTFTAASVTAAQGRKRPSVHRRTTDERDAVHAEHGIRVGLQKEGSSDACCHVDAPRGRYPEGNEPDTEAQTRRGPTHVGTQRGQSHRDRKSAVGPGPGEGAGSEGVMGTEGQLGRWKVLETVVAMAAQPSNSA